MHGDTFGLVWSALVIIGNSVVVGLLYFRDLYVIHRCRM